MGTMTVTDQIVTAAKYAKLASLLLELLPGITKTDLRVAVATTDQWISDNASSFNNSLPSAVRTNFTASQKAKLFMLVADERFGTGVF